MNETRRGLLFVALVLILFGENFLVLLVLKIGVPQVLALLPSGAATLRAPPLQAYYRAAMTLQEQPWLLRGIVATVWLPLVVIGIIPRLRRIGEVLLAFWCFLVLMFITTCTAPMLQMLAIASRYLR